VRQPSMSIVKLQAMQPGERTSPEGKPVSNRLLLAMRDEEFRSVRPHLEFVNLPHHLSLHQPHRTVRFAHFPNEGLISLVVELKDGKSVEAGLLGKDGASGMPAVLGLSRSPLREIVQIAGSGFRVRIGTLREIVQTAPQIQVILGRYAAGLAMQVAQTAACNRLHKIEERLARWLLIAQDRLESGTVPITHDFLATMLGTDRPSVTLAAGVLQKKGIIVYMRGSVKILNRQKLEEFACECYAIVSQYNSGS
jgi:CRP-like cAMP-binding protein